MKTNQTPALTRTHIAIPSIGIPKRAARLACRIALIALLSAAGFSAGVSAVAQSSHSSTTVILVRHAEKKIVPPENKDPDLSPAGIARAQELVRMFGDTGVAAIYATQFKRTLQTVKPLADKLGIPVTQVEAKKTTELVKQIRARNAGQVIFIAGHNNTVPEIIAALGGPQLPIIPETEFDNLYILTVESDGSAKLLKLRYGSPLPANGQGMMNP
ncbi:MAG: histidine phosphatase family protein [Acidobacteriota bacterium]|nr:histidine phosphatase family protein [Acidobacteriota bacterium]